jgi:transglutaminase-like putative cysteine protease
MMLNNQYRAGQTNQSHPSASYITMIVVGLFGAIVALHIGYVDGWLLSIVGLLLVVRVLTLLPQFIRSLRQHHIMPLGYMLPTWLSTILMLSLCVWAWVHYGTLLGQEPAVSLMLLMAALKTFEMRAIRDCIALIMLCFFGTVSIALYDQSLTITLMVMLIFMSLLAMLAWCHMTVSVESTTSVIRQQLKSAYGQALQLSVLAIPLMVTLFVLFPRLDHPLWGFGRQSRVQQAVTGLSQDMRPGQVSDLVKSSEIALRAKFNGAVPPLRQMYWRAGVLGHFDGSTWRQTYVDMAQRDIEMQFFNATPAYTYQVTQEPADHQWLLLLEMPMSLPTLKGINVRVQPDFQLLLPQPLTERLRFDATLQTRYRFNPQESRLVLQRFVELPPSYNPKTLTLTAEWAQQFAVQQHQRATPMTEAQVTQHWVSHVMNYFHTQGFQYSTTPPLLQQHSVDDFLFRTKTGFCEHYAQAFVVMMRALDIPARVVTGYLGGEINPTDGFLEVHQYDAHAWAEVWFPHQGWQRVDPTGAVAPERIERGAQAVVAQASDPVANSPVLGSVVDVMTDWFGLQQHWVKQLRQQTDALNNQFNQWVLNYRGERQADVLRQLGLKRRLDQPIGWQDLIPWLIVTALFMLGGYWILREAKMKRSPADQAWHDFCKQMDDLGYAKPHWMGPVDYRDYLTEQMQHDARLMAQQTHIYREISQYVIATYKGVPQK